MLGRLRECAEDRRKIEGMHAGRNDEDRMNNTSNYTLFCT